jgi:plastocyanin
MLSGTVRRRSRCTRPQRALAALVLAAAGELAPPVAASEPAEAQQAAGEISGRVALFHKKLFRKPQRAKEVRDVVVYVTGFTSGPASGALAELDQRGEQFAPRLLPVVAGQEVAFPNRDRIYHNVFSVSPVKSFDLGQYKSSDPAKRARFERPGLVPVYCNIHPHMIAYVVVLENSAYALASPDGSFRIRDVPPGRRLVHAWTPGAPAAVSREIDVAAGATASVSFELTSGAIPSHRRKDGSEYPPPGSEAER